MANKKILLIAPYSYPVGGPECIVNAKFTKLLTDIGYVVDLISVKSKSTTYKLSSSEYYFSGVRYINVLESDNPPKIKRLIRQVIYSLKASIYVGGFTGLTYGTIAILQTAEVLCKHNKYDYIITKVGGDKVGLYCSKRYKTRLIITFNDPWPRRRYPEPYGHGQKAEIPWYVNIMLGNIAKISYKILFPSERLKDYVLSYLPDVARSKGIVFPHTVTSALISEYQHEPDLPGLTLIHTGSTGLWRDPQSLCEGLSLFLERHTNAKITIKFLGVEQFPASGRALKDYLNKYKISEHVEQIPPVSYEDSLEFVKHSDVCIILEADLEEGIFMPTKITDYQQYSKPIWAISPQEGVLNDLYRENVIEYFSNVASVESVRDTLERIYSDYEQNKLRNYHSDRFYDVNVMKDVKKVLG